MHHCANRRQVGAEIGQEREAQREKCSCRIERELRVHAIAASTRIGKKCLAPRRLPLDRPAQTLGGKQHGRVFGFRRASSAKTAADIAIVQLNALRGDAEHRRQMRAHHRHSLGRQPDIVFAVASGGSASARLHRVADDSLAVKGDSRHVRSLLERRAHCGCVAGFILKAGVRGDIVVQELRAMRASLPGVRHRGQLFVFDFHQLNGIFGERRGIRDRHRHQLTGKTHPVERDRVPARLQNRFSAESGVAHETRRPGKLRHVRAEKNERHPWRRPGARGVDALDTRMRAVRAQKVRVQLAGHIDVSRVTPAADQQPMVFNPRQFGAPPWSGKLRQPCKIPPVDEE